MRTTFSLEQLVNKSITYVISEEVTSKIYEDLEDQYKTFKAYVTDIIEKNDYEFYEDLNKRVLRVRNENVTKCFQFKTPHKIQKLILKQDGTYPSVFSLMSDEGLISTSIYAHVDDYRIREMLSYTVDEDYLTIYTEDNISNRLIETIKFTFANGILLSYLFSRLMNRNYEYVERDVKKLTRAEKLNNKNAAISTIRHRELTVDFKKLEELKTVFINENSKKGSGKSPHERAGHYRHLKSGKTIFVKSSKVKGGSDKTKLINIV